MTLIKADLGAFSNALNNSQVICTSEGYWTKIPKSLQQSHALIGVDHHRLNKIASVFMHCLDDLEKSPASSNLSAEEVNTYIDTANHVIEILEDADSKKVQNHCIRLKSRIVALEARHGLSVGERADTETISKIYELASNWKLASHIRGHEDLDSTDRAHLDKLVQHHDFVEQLAVDEDLRSRFFNWTLRDRVDPQPFIHFPSICQRLTEARLSHRIGFHGGEHLKLTRKYGEKDFSRMDLTLPMGGREVSILDDRLIVELGEGYSQSVGQIINTFVNRQWEIGNVEYFQDGIRNWNPKRLGSYIPETGEYKQVDFQQEKWWENLPVVEELTIEQANQRFDLELDGSDWVMAIRAAREQENDTPISIHGWMQVAIPVNGRYRLLDFGKYTEEFPRAWYEFIAITVNTVPAVITYPDEAAFSLDRQHTWEAVKTSAEEGERLFSSIKTDLENVNDENIAFQFVSDNCIKWAWNKVNEVVGDDQMPPEVVQMSFSDLEPGGIMGFFFKILRILPFEIRWLILTMIVSIFGAWRSMKIQHLDGTEEDVSLISRLPWSKGEKFFSPGQVFRYQNS